MHHTTHTLSRTPHTLYTQGKTRAVEPASRRIMHEVWNAHGWQVRYGAMAALDNICLRPSDARHGWGRLNAPIARVGARTPTWACSTLFVTTLRGGATSIQACARRAAASSDYLYTVKPRACAATIGVVKRAVHEAQHCAQPPDVQRQRERAVAQAAAHRLERCNQLRNDLRIASLRCEDCRRSVAPSPRRRRHSPEERADIGCRAAHIARGEDTKY